MKDNHKPQLAKELSIKIVIGLVSFFVLIILLLTFSLPKTLKDTQAGLSYSPTETNSKEKSTDFLAMCLKTGMETIIDRVPVQLMSFLRDDTPLIISDFQETMAGIEVINVLSKHEQRTSFPKYRHAKSITVDEQSPDQNDGWKLDAGKNIPGFKRMYYEFPNAKWFIMFDDDTYLFKNNLIAHLKTLDHTQPFYLGNPLGLSPCGENGEIENGVFGHGGSGIVLSKGAMEKMVPIADKCSQRHGKCMLGDLRTALCLNDAGIRLDTLKSQYDFRGRPFQKEAFRDACDTTFTFHHLFPSQIKQLHDIEMEVQRLHGPDAEINMGQLFYWFVRKDPLLVSTSEESVSIKIDSKSFEYRVDMNFEGGDYDHFNSSLTNCISNCYEDSKCFSWTFNAVENTCWKKNVIPVPTKIEKHASGWFEEKFECNRKVICTSYTECHDI